MPLSEHEQRLLDDIEKALYAEDPKFAASVRTAARRRAGRSRRWIAVSALGVLAGLGLVLLGLLIQNPIPAVVGFVLIVAAVVQATMAVRAGPAPAPGTAGAARGGPGRPPANGLRARMEDRMRRRFEDNGNR